MPRRKKSEDIIENDEEEEEVHNESGSENEQENEPKTLDGHIPPLWQHHKPRTNGKRLDWRDWTRDAEPVRKKSKKNITPQEKLEHNNRKTRNECVIAQTDRLKKVKQSLVKSTTADFQKNLDEFIRVSCQNKIISSITANFNSSCNSSALHSAANSDCNSEIGSERSFVFNRNFNDTNLDATQHNSGMPYNNNIPCAVIVGGAVNFTQIADIFKNSGGDSEYKKIINFEPAHGKSQKNMLESLIEQAISDPQERKAQGLSSTAFLTFSRVIRVLTHKFDGLQPMILNFFNVESFNGQVLSDFLDMLYSNQNYLPTSLIFHVATMLSSFTRILRSSILSKIKMEKINIPPARDFQEQLVDTLYFKQDHQGLTESSDNIYLSYDSLLKVNDQFTRLDQSVDLVLKSVEFAMKQERFDPNLTKFDENKISEFGSSVSRYYSAIELLHNYTFPSIATAKYVTYRIVIQSQLGGRKPNGFFESKKFQGFISDLKLLNRPELKARLSSLVEFVMDESVYEIFQSARFDTENLSDPVSLDSLVEKMVQIEMFLTPEDFDPKDPEMLDFLGMGESYENKENEHPKTSNVNRKSISSTKQLQKELLRRSLANQNGKSQTAYEKLRNEGVNCVETILKLILQHPGTKHPELYKRFFYSKPDKMRERMQLDVKSEVLGVLETDPTEDYDEFYPKNLTKNSKTTQNSKNKLAQDTYGIAHKETYDYNNHRVYTTTGAGLKIVNMADWCNAYSAGIGEEFTSCSSYTHFLKCMNMLKFVGIVRNSARRTDHVDQLVWSKQF